MTRVLAVDPGGTTGIAWYDTDEGVHKSVMVEGQMDALSYVESLLVLKSDVLVVERFTITAATLRKTREGSNTAIEIIGALRWMAHRTDIAFVEQSPADAKNFLTDAKLKRLNWYTPGRDHARDASRHLGLYLFKHRLIDAALLLSDAREGE